MVGNIFWRTFIGNRVVIIIITFFIVPMNGYTQMNADKASVIAYAQNIKQDIPVRMQHAIPIQGIEAPQYYSFDVWQNEVVQQYIKRYLTESGLRYMVREYQRARNYRHFIINEIMKQNMPIELFFLPLIESGYNNNAYSHVGATGMWQFMDNSIAPWLKKNEWVDERKDFWKATKAALAKLQYNFEVFQDWFLALAAYNAGITRVKRAIEKAGGVYNFWALYEGAYLPKQTLNYVPKFLAIVYIMSYPGRYGLELTWDDAVEWEIFEDKYPIHLTSLQQYSGIDAEIILDGNKELYYGISMINEKGLYQIKVPKSNVARLHQIMNNEENRLASWNLYKIRVGDTLYDLALTYEIPLQVLLMYNPTINPYKIRPGDTVMIPILQNTQKKQSDTRSSVVKESSKKLEILDNVLSIFSFIDKKKASIMHIVVKGDTIWDIARQYNTSEEMILLWNERELDTLLHLGEILYIPKELS